MEAHLSQLPEYLQTRRWFAGKAWPIKQARLIDHVDLEARGRSFTVAVVEILYELGAPERYLMPVRLWEGRFQEALEDDDLARRFLEILRAGGELEAGAGVLRGERAPGSERAWEGLSAEPSVRRLAAEQTNTSVVFDERVILKVIRKLEPGLHPEVEMGLYLSRKGFSAVPPLLGWLSFTGAADATIAVAHGFVRGAEDGWGFVLERFRASERLAPELLGELRKLGRRVGELHNVLASEAEDLAFTPEEIRSDDLQRWSSSIIGQLGVAVAEAAEVAPELAANRGPIAEHARALAELPPSGLKIRVHGDLHLGQVLRSADDWLFFDFEGEPRRTFSQRREKHSPLKDVAGMLRSFSYAEAAVELEGKPAGERATFARQAFLEGYFDATRGAAFLPSDREAAHTVLRALELEKAIYELRYELGHRPEWVKIPLRALRGAMA